MQARDRKKVKRTSLLKWLFDVFRCLVPESKHDPTQKILRLRRVLQSSTNCVLHPCPRLLRQAQNRVATAVPNQCAVLRIADKEHSTDVVTRQIRAHIEFTGISRRRDDFRGSEKLQFITKFRRTFPTDLPDSVCRLFPTSKFE